MKGRSIADYIWLGLRWRYLQDATAGTSIHGNGFILENIKAVRKKLLTFELHVTERAATELSELEAKLETTDKTTTLTTEQANKLKEAMKILQRTLQAETSGNVAYIVTDKRLDIKKLLNNVSALFAPNVFTSIPEIARSDFEEAGKCIAFERATAAAFHILRGTESVVSLLYRRFIRPAHTGLTWGQMTHALSNKNKGKKPDSVILQNLDHIRNSFRNPTQHPEKLYDIQEVQDLFGLCIDAVNRIMAAIKKK